MRVRVVALLLVLGLVASSCSSAGEPEAVAVDPREDVRSAVEALVAAGVPGAVVHVFDETYDFALTSGKSVLDGDDAIAQNAMFEVGGIAHTFLVVVTLRLREEGLISLDDTIENWLPGEFAYGQQVTIRDLLRRRDGIPEYYNVGLREPEAGFEQQPGTVVRRCLAPVEKDRRGVPIKPDETKDPKCIWGADKILELVEDQDTLYPPGTAFNWSNTSPVVLATILEEATGRTYPELLDAFVISRLSLGSTVYVLEFKPTDRPTRLVNGYGDLFIDEDDDDIDDSEGLDEISRVYPLGASHGGRLYSSARNLSTFFQATLEGDLLLKESRDEMLDGFPTADGDNAYGMGVELPFGVGAPIVMSTSESAGQTAIVQHNLDSNRTVVVLSTRAGQGPISQWQNLLSAASGVPCEVRERAVTGVGQLPFVCD